METIAILTGGDSAEQSISLKSAETVLKHLDKKKYSGYIVNLSDNKYSCKILNWIIRFFLKTNNRKIKFDKIFVALHGPPAENDWFKLFWQNKYSIYITQRKYFAITFNKYECNKKLNEYGFKTARSLLISSKKIDLENNINCLVCKPNNGSLWIKVKNINEFKSY